MKKKKLLLFILSIFALFFTSLSSLSFVHAEEKYSDVLTDLKKDTNFSEDYYTVDDSVIDISVIQIAETPDKELLIYTYQPANKTKEVKASSISMSLTIDNNINPSIYDLTFINSNSVFAKYVVDDFVANNDMIHYYEIISIFRPFNEEYDTQPDDNNTINEISYPVGSLFCAAYTGDSIVYSRIDRDYVEITDKWCGFIRYDKGLYLSFGFYTTAVTDSHFVVFSTNRKIDTLEEAKVSFISQKMTFHSTGLNDETIEDEPVNEEVVVKASETVENENRLCASKFKWNRIQTIEEFKKTDGDNLKEEYTNKLDGMRYVLRFKETTNSSLSGDGYSTRTWTEISNVTILRLKFQTDGVSYNLGVVDNKQTGSTNPAGEVGKDWTDLEKLLQNIMEVIGTILQILALVLIVVLCSPILAVILPIIFKAIMYVIKFIISIITWPFRAISNKRRNK